MRSGGCKPGAKATTALGAREARPCGERVCGARAAWGAAHPDTMPRMERMERMERGTFEATSGNLPAPGAVAPVGTPTVDPNPVFEPPAPDRLRQLGRYIILGHLGSGGMSVVHEAYDPELDRKVALKILRGIPGGVSTQGRLLREGQALARITHANVVRVYDVGIDQGQVFIAMERIQGVTLRVWLASAARSLPEILAVFIAAGRGLAEAHAAGIIHRDFKPENALIDATGTLRIVDFGLARGFGEDGERDPAALPSSPTLGLPITQVGAVIGTLAYMAPEQLAGASIDARVDIFAFCVALFEAVYGARPFAGETAAEQLASIARGPAVPATRRIKPELHAAIVRGLAADPKDRWPSIAALTDRLQALARPSRRGAAALVLLAGVAGVGVFMAMPAAAQPCSSVGQEIAETWSPQIAASVGEALGVDEGGFVDATWRRALPQLDGYAGRWSDTRLAVCEAREQGAVSERLHDLEVGCLASRREALAATVAVIRRRGPAIVDELEELVETLPDLASCRDPARVQVRWAPPDDPAAAARVTALEARLADAEASMTGGDVARAEELLAGIKAELEGLAVPALVADLARVEGMLAARQGRAESMFAAERRRFASSLTIGDHEAAALAAAELVGATEEPGAAQAWQAVAEALLEGPGAHALARATLDLKVGEAAQDRGDLHLALRTFEQGLALAREDAGVPWTLHLSLLQQALGLMAALGRYDNQEATLTELLTIVTDRRAEGHPEQIRARTFMAEGWVQRGDFEKASALLDEAATAIARGGVTRRDLSFEIATLRALIAGLRLDVPAFDVAFAQALSLASTPKDRLRLFSYAGSTYSNAGQLERAIAAFEAGIAAVGDDAPPALALRRFEIQGLLAGLYLQVDRLDDAEANYAAVLQATTAQPGPLAFFGIEAKAGLGDVLLRRGKTAEARREIEEALAMLEGRELPPGFVGNLHYALARALWAADEPRAREHIALAIRDFSPLPNAQPAIADIEAWVAEHSAKPRR